MEGALVMDLYASANVVLATFLAVVPAHAGIHNHREEFVAPRLHGFLSNNKYYAVWVPAFAGTTEFMARNNGSIRTNIARPCRRLEAADGFRDHVLRQP